MTTLFLCAAADLDAPWCDAPGDDPNACRRCGEWLWAGDGDADRDGEDDAAAYQQHCAHCGAEIYGGGDG